MKPIVILEVANNHMGDISHGKKIIKTFDKITRKYREQIDFIIKYQYRDSKKFIHKKSNKNNKFVKRFSDTFLSDKEWKILIKYTKNFFKVACTPFDEPSAEKVFKQKFDYVKIASCSSTDWPLIEKIYSLYKKKKKKIFISLGGLSEREISRVFSFFNNRKVDFNFFYCIAKYPSNETDLNLSYFSKLRKDYGNRVLGLSLHETADINITPTIAYCAGVRIFEKHVGLETNKYQINDYSVSPENLDIWLKNLIKGIDLWGSENIRNKNAIEEKRQLDLLKRGVYLKNNVKKNGDIFQKDLYFAFPCKPGQLQANNLSKNLKISSKISLNKDEPLNIKDINIIDTYSKVLVIRDKIKNFLRNSGVILPNNPRLEISFHYGMEKFYKYGLTMINVINNDKYCKKLLILLPGQKHPAQYHKIKKESFFILHGKVELKINKKIITLDSGNLKTIKAKEVHEFSSKNGAIIEELSTTSVKSDSFYIDKKINNNRNRKTYIYL